MSDKSWRVKTYQEGSYKITVRKNLENDRVDEGDYPEEGPKEQTNPKIEE